MSIGLSPWEVAQLAADAAALIAAGGATCTVTRESGRGSNTATATVGTSVGYWRDDPTRARLAALAGGWQTSSVETLYVALDAPALHEKDTVVDDADPTLRWQVDSVARMTQGAVQVAYCSRQVA